MNVLVFASRKGGSGKSTLAAHLAAHVARPSHPVLLVDADPQGSLSLWHERRGQDALVLKRGTRQLAETLKAAAREGVEWAFIDTPPNTSSAVAESLRQATMVVIPARPSLFDLDAVRDTILLARELRKPYAVVLNGAPAKRSGAEAMVVAEARAALQAMEVPLWSGQLTHRSDFSLAIAAGEGAQEYDSTSAAAQEIAQLWTAISRSAKVIEEAGKDRGSQRLAA